MRILVTGGSGFMGTNLVEHFVARNDDVLSLDIEAPRNPAHSGVGRVVDLLDFRATDSAVRDFAPDVILHLAARTDLNGRSVGDYAVNTTGVENIVAAAQSVRSLRYIMLFSSRLVCRIGYSPTDEFDYCPTTPYGESKVVGERIVRAARLNCPWVIVRPTSIWGPWFDEPYKTFFLSIVRGRYFHPGSARILKSFGFVGNTVHEVQQLLDAPADRSWGKTLYLADYPAIEVAAMAIAIQRAFGAKPIRTVPVQLLRPAAWIGDRLKTVGWRNPPLTSFRLDNLITPMVHDLSPLQDIVGPLPYSMEDGIQITVAWLKDQGLPSRTARS